MCVCVCVCVFKRSSAFMSKLDNFNENKNWRKKKQNTRRKVKAELFSPATVHACEPALCMRADTLSLLFPLNYDSTAVLRTGKG